MSDVLVLIGPGLAADEALLGEIAERELASLGVRGVITRVRGAEDVRARTRRRHPGEAGEGRHAVVILPGPEDLRELMKEPLGPVTWVDLWRVDDAEVDEDASHIHGRGIAGLRWGIRHAVHRLRYPHRRVSYGPHRDQWAHLYLPAATPAGDGASSAAATPADGDASSAAEEPALPRRKGGVPGLSRAEAAEGPFPVVALVHGGYWRSMWTADLMEALCGDLVGRGFAVWNLEYRRPDLHGWDTTTSDVAEGLRALGRADAPLDLGRVAVAGHSAGGQLALRAAADGAPVSLAVSLAGVLDLVEGDRRWVGTGAVAAALDVNTFVHTDQERSIAERVYGGSSPLLRVPLKVRQLVVQGSGDDLDLIDFARRYARAAANAGDEVTYLEMPGDHWSVIDPTSPIWQATARALEEALR